MAGSKLKNKRSNFSVTAKNRDSESNSKHDIIIKDKRGDEKSENAEETSYPSSNTSITSIIIFIIAFTVYSRTMHPSLPGGDSGELIVAAHESGVAHPPGYPLFTIFSKVFITVLPFGSVAWRVSLFAVVCAAATCSLLHLAVCRLTLSQGAGLFAAGMFGFSRLVWTWSVAAEVFSLNDLLLSLLIWIAVIFDQKSNGKATGKLCLSGAFVCGLCLANQHTSVLYIAVIVPWVFYHLWLSKELTGVLLLQSTVCFLCGLMPYAYLPWASWRKVARWTWGDQTTLGGFLTHVLRVEYGTLDLLKDHSGQGFLVGLRAYSYHLYVSFTVPFLILLILSLWSRYHREISEKRVPSILPVLWIMLFAYLLFFCWRANLDINKPLFFKVVERFWLQSDLVLCLLASIGYNQFWRFLARYLGIIKVDLAFWTAAVLVSLQISRNWSACDNSHNYKVHDFAVQTFEAFPADSIILTKGDLPSNSLRYFHLCEDVRKDLHLFDQEVLTYEWSLPAMRHHHPGIKFPGDLLLPKAGVRKDGKRSFTFKSLIDANYDSHAIFACIGVQEYEPSWQSSYTLRPFGVCWQLVHGDTPLNVKQLVNRTASVTQGWKYPWHSHDDGSWEFVASSEMWRARTATAFYLLEQALALPAGRPEISQLLMASYELYTDEIIKYPSVPSFWHRNYAIVCERLARETSSPLDPVDLLRKAHTHFGTYLGLEPDDPDREKIRGALAALKGYIDSV